MGKFACPLQGDPVMTFEARSLLPLGRATRRALAAGVSIGALLIASPAQATVIITGNVVPSTLTTNPTTASQIIVGFGSTPGTLEINASAAGNGFTTVTGNFSGGIGVVIGSGATGIGTIEVDGNGTAGSATLTTPKAITLGASGGDGTLLVQNGGLAQTTTDGSQIQAGNTDSSGDVTVDGANSQLISGGRLQIGAFSGSTGSITISGGGVANLTSAAVSENVVEIGTGDDATGTAMVTGANSALNTKGLIVGSSEVGSATPNAGALTIANGAAMNVESFGSGAGGGVFVGSATGSQVTVTGAGSTLSVDAITSGFNAGKEILIGGFGQGTLLVDDSAIVDATGANVFVGGGFTGSLTDPGTLTVRNGAELSAANVTVRTNGLLNGDGTISGNVILDGGTIAPGNSPGTMTVVGDMILNDGVLEIEIGALVTDLFDVSGNVFLGENLLISLIFEFEPMGEIYDIEDFFTGFAAFNADPGFSIFDNVAVSGLAAGNSVVVTFGNERTIFATAVPEPGTIGLVLIGLAALTLGRRRDR
jgi:T5SS/PEP-CTERM-associated repeat protein